MCCVFTGSHGDYFVVHSGYVDDPRATDNAWIETVAIHMHCPFDLGSELKLCPGDDMDEARWVDVDSLLETSEPLYAIGRHCCCSLLLLTALLLFRLSRSQVRVSRRVARACQSADERAINLARISSREMGAVRRR
jgi:hypothetical protein